MQQAFDKAVGGSSNFSTAIDKYGKATAAMLPTNMGVKYKSTKPTKTGSTEILNNPSPHQPLHQVNTYAKETKHSYSHKVKTEKSSVFSKYGATSNQQPMTPVGTGQQFAGQGMRKVTSTLSPVCENVPASQITYSNSQGNLQLQKQAKSSNPGKQPNHMSNH